MRLSKRILAVLSLIAILTLFVVSGCNEQPDINGLPRPVYPPPIGMGSEIEPEPQANLDATKLFSSVRGISAVETAQDIPPAFKDRPDLDKKGIKITADLSGASIYYTQPINANSFKGNLAEFEIYYGGQFSNIKQFEVSVEDIYDKNNGFTVIWWAHPDMGGTSYMLVRCNGVTKGVANEGIGVGLPRGEYGSVFWRNGFRESVDARGHAPFHFRYDDETKQVIADVGVPGGNNFVVLDLDDIEHMGSQSALFKGFTTGEVYIKFGFPDTTGSGSVFVSKIAGKKLNEQNPEAGTAPAITLDMDYDYYNNNLPQGVKGVEYKLPVPTGYDIIRGKYAVSATLKKGGQDLSSVITEDYTFIPPEAGEYVLTYACKDIRGFDVEKSFDIDIADSARPLSISVTEQSGEEYRVKSFVRLPDVVYSGGNGKLTTNTVYTFNGISIVPDSQNRYYFNDSGVLTITASATDYLGAEKTETKEILISEGVVITPHKYIPDGAVRGSKMPVPDFDAVDYGNKSREVQRKTYVDTGSGYELLDAQKRTVTVPDADSFKIKYTADEGAPSETSSEYTVKVLTPAASGDLRGYFMPEENVQLSIDDGTWEKDNGIKVYTQSAAQNKTGFANAIGADYAQLLFSVDKNNINYTYLQIKMTDSLDSSASVSMRFYKAPTQTLLRFKDAGGGYTVEHALSGTFAQGSTFELIYTDTFKSFITATGIQIAAVPYYDDGNEFSGFKSGAFKIEFSFGGVTGGSSYYISRMGNQSFAKLYYQNGDRTVPQLVLSRPLGDGYARIDTQITVPSAKSFDVLQYGTYTEVEVKAPSGNNAVELTDADKDITFTLSEYGVYRIIYYFEDYNLRKDRKEILITVNDRIPPEITVGGSYKEEYALGTAISLFGAELSDNITPKEEITFYVMIADTKTNLWLLKPGDTFTFDRQGYYIITYYARDAAGNVSAKDFKVFVA